MRAVVVTASRQASGRGRETSISPRASSSAATRLIETASSPSASASRIAASTIAPGDSRCFFLAAFAEVALDAAGNAFAVFGFVGEPVTFGVSSFDVFPFTTSWTFGDGGLAQGGTVSHVYTRPGAYPVTVSAVDGGGNTSTEIGAIAIAAKTTNPPPRPRQPIALALRIEGQTLRKLRRTGNLRVVVGVNEAASVALSGQAKLRVRRARGRTRTKLVPAFTAKTVSLAAASEAKVTLALSKRGRKALRSLSRVRLLIRGEARDDVGGLAIQTAARAFR